jgi:hypothetical protein
MLKNIHRLDKKRSYLMTVQAQFHEEAPAGSDPFGLRHPYGGGARRNLRPCSRQVRADLSSLDGFELLTPNGKLATYGPQ